MHCNECMSIRHLLQKDCILKHSRFLILQTRLIKDRFNQDSVLRWESTPRTKPDLGLNRPVHSLNSLYCKKQKLLKRSLAGSTYLHVEHHYSAKHGAEFGVPAAFLQIKLLQCPKPDIRSEVQPCSSLQCCRPVMRVAYLHHHYLWALPGTDLIKV